ncbi:LOB domain-containing protein 35 [Cardamine amara subsp. amara]|uniref:LOB domain-containing protein 35 n=1 Tax=Cardamine amara subsp. amara TaxID=228776 RepID=A0ABD1C690_CARAN
MNPTSCSACKVMKRECTLGCILKPHFPSTKTGIFECLHTVFGGDNVFKILSNLQPFQRENAVIALCYKAEARVRDPISGYYGRLLKYQNDVKILDEQIKRAKSELASIIGPDRVPPYPNNILPTHNSLLSDIDGRHGNAGSSTSVGPSMALGSTSAIREKLPPLQNQNQP